MDSRIRANAGMRSVIHIVVAAGLTVGCAHGNVTQLRGLGQAGHSPMGTWESVQGVSGGTRISVAHVGGGTTEGEVVSVAVEGFVVSSKGKAVEIRQTAVEQVLVVTAGDHATGAKWGFLVGAGAGALVGGLTVESNRGAWMLMLSAGWGALGAVVGALGTEQRSQVIYHR
jgi:hypothetical protein